ncbi:MAG: hypothetical protein ACU85U_03865 [Gammaproteobacteria bacterium]
MALPIGWFRLLTDEIRMIVAEALIPPSNLFFLETLWPEEKRALLDSGAIAEPMIRNRIQNTEITAEERELLEEYL